MSTIFFITHCILCLFCQLEELDQLLNSQQSLFEPILKSEGLSGLNYLNGSCSATFYLNENDGTLTYTITNIRLDYLHLDLEKYFSSPAHGVDRFSHQIGFWKVDGERQTPPISGLASEKTKERYIQLEPNESFSKSIKIWDIENLAMPWENFCKIIETDKSGRYEIYSTICFRAKLILNNNVYEGERVIVARLPIDYKTVQKMKQLQIKEKNKELKKQK
jgi:hypothetical protein